MFKTFPFSSSLWAAFLFPSPFSFSLFFSTGPHPPSFSQPKSFYQPSAAQPAQRRLLPQATATALRYRVEHAEPRLDCLPWSAALVHEPSSHVMPVQATRDDEPVLKRRTRTERSHPCWPSPCRAASLLCLVKLKLTPCGTCAPERSPFYLVATAEPNPRAHASLLPVATAMDAPCMESIPSSRVASLLHPSLRPPIKGTREESLYPTELTVPQTGHH